MIIEAKSIEDLRQRADIVSVIEHYVEVKKSGSAFVCLCPFHADKNPSMSINAIKGFYHCFACKAGGDVFKFVQEFERIGFYDAVERVASLCNFTLSYTGSKNVASREIYEILPLLNAFYKQNLSKHQNALHYLYNRALSDEDIRKFELGFAPSSDESLRLLKNEKIDFKNALECGALKFSVEQKSYYASFINRISFPIYDYKGALIGFGGRTLDAENKAKYVNSPQCRLFDKSRVFYALNLAKESIAKQGEMIVCEGYMDAIAFHKAGLNNAVAVLGTALTQNHLPLIKRYEARVILCFDSDSAGFNAAMRSAFLLSTNKIAGKVASLQGGKDAAELVASGQAKLLYNAIDKGVELGEFYIRGLLSGISLQSPLDKQRALEAIQRYTFNLEPIVAQGYEPLVAQLLGVSENYVKLDNQRREFDDKGVNFRGFGDNFSGLNGDFGNAFGGFSNGRAKNSQIAEFPVLKFLFENENERKKFTDFSDETYFAEKETLQKILANADINDELVREFLFRAERFEHKNLANLGENSRILSKNLPQNSQETLENRVGELENYLLGLCKINLSYINKIKTPDPVLALKKQLLMHIEKHFNKIKKKLCKNDTTREFLDEKREFSSQKSEFSGEKREFLGENCENDFIIFLREKLRLLKQSTDIDELSFLLKNFKNNIYTDSIF